MAQISIKPSDIRGCVQQEEEVEKTVRALAQKISDIQGKLNYKIAGQEEIRLRLSQTVETINLKADAIKSLETGLMEIANRYEQTEQGNAGREIPDKVNNSSGSNSNSTGANGASGGSNGDNQENSGGSFFAFLTSVFDILNKQELIPGLPKSIIEYPTALYRFFTGDKRGLTGAQDLLNLTGKSIDTWNGLYEILKGGGKNDVPGLSIFADSLVFIGSLCGARGNINKGNLGTAGSIGEYLGTGADAVNVGKDVAELLGADAGVVSPLNVYSSIARGYLDAFSQGFKSYETYSSDGKFDARDVGATGVEFAVSGLYGIVDSLTFGIPSAIGGENQAQAISAGLENWAAGVGDRAGQYIVDNPGLNEVYDKAGTLGKVGITFYSAIASLF